MNAISGCVLFVCLFLVVCILVLVVIADPEYYKDNQEGAEDDKKD